MPLPAALNSSGYEIFGLDVVELSDIWKQLICWVKRLVDLVFSGIRSPGLVQANFAKLILPDQARPKQIIKKSYEVSNYLKKTLELDWNP